MIEWMVVGWRWDGRVAAAVAGANGAVAVAGDDGAVAGDAWTVNRGSSWPVKRKMVTDRRSSWRMANRRLASGNGNVKTILSVIRYTILIGERH